MCLLGQCARSYMGVSDAHSPDGVSSSPCSPSGVLGYEWVVGIALANKRLQGMGNSAGHEVLGMQV